MDAALVACRFAQYASLFLLLGAALGRFLPGAEAAGPALRRLARGAAAGALTAAAGCLLLVAGEMGGGWAAAADPGTVGAVLADTEFGRVSLARLALAALLLLLAPGVPLAAGSAALLGSLALVGHAVAEDGAAGVAHRLGDALHLVAGGAWLGGLVPLLLVLRAARPEAAARALRRFSRLGYVAVAAVLATGALNAAFLGGSPLAWPGSDWGRVLLLKLGLVAGLLLLAATNRLRLLPALPATLPALRRSALAEAALGALVLAAVSALGTLPPAAFVATP